MTFGHEGPEFIALLTRVSAETGIAAALVEKDYWVTHSLWALHETQFAIWFKGGTSHVKAVSGVGACLRCAWPLRSLWWRSSR